MQSSSNRPGQRPTNRYIEDNQQRSQRRDRRLLNIIVGALCLILPPVGLFIAWKSDRIQTIARMGLTLVALFGSTVIFTIVLNATMTHDAIRPVPVVPGYAGYDVAAAEPTPEPVDLYTFPEEDTASQESETFVVTYGDGSSENLGGDDQTAQTGEATTDQEKPLDPLTYTTVVYAVTNNATYFHTQQVCDYQTNSRILTLDEARAEGLLPCEKCAQQYIN